jgi:hypothetical protein
LEVELVSQKIAVAVIHGAGSQHPDYADTLITRVKRGFQTYLPPENNTVADKLVFKVIYWANILAKKQRILWNSVTDDDATLRFTDFRKFIINFGADAVAYQPGAKRREIYGRVHKTVAAALTGLARDAGADAPLCIIGHSIGTVITHNYFFDLGDKLIANEPLGNSTTSLEAGKTLAFLYWLGSPLALWSLRYEHYKAITFPGRDLTARYPGLKPKWVSYYDRDDILAYPIRSLSKGHKQLAEQGLLKDVLIEAGGLLTSWNPLSHLDYLKNEDVTRDIARDLFEAWQAINPAD